MSGQLGDLSIDLNANIAKFVSAMDAAARKSQETSEAIKGYLVGGVAALAGGVSIAALTEFTRRTIEAAAAIDDWAAQTGISGQKLGALANIAADTGASMDAIVGATVKLTKNLQDIDQAGSPAAGALKAIGLNAAEFKGLSMDEQLVRIAQKMDGFADGAGKTNVALALFGKSGADMLPVLKDLAEAGELNSLMTSDMAKNAADAEDALRRFGRQQTELGRVMVLSLTPAITAVFGALTDLTKSSREAGADNSLQQWGFNVARTFGFVIDMAQGVSRIVKAVGNDIGALAAAAATWLGSSAEDKWNGKARAQVGAIFDARNQDFERLMNAPLFSQQLEARIAEFQKNAGKPAAARQGLNFSGPAAAQAGRTVADEGEKFVESLRRQVEKMEQGEFALMRMEAAQKKVTAAAEPYIAKLEEAKRQQAALADYAAQVQAQEQAVAANDRAYANFVTTLGAANEALAWQVKLTGLTGEQQRILNEQRRVELATAQALRGVTDPDTQRRILEEGARASEQAVALVQAQIDRQKELNTLWEVGAVRALQNYSRAATNVAQHMEGVFEGAFKGLEATLLRFTTTGKLSFQELGAVITAEMSRIFIRQNITGPLAQGLMGWMQGGSQRFDAAAGQGESGSGLFDWLKGILPGFAVGTQYVPNDMLAVVHKGEQIIPAGSQGPGLGGISLSITNHIDSRSDRAAIAADLQAFGRGLVAQLQQATARGGAGLVRGGA